MKALSLLSSGIDSPVASYLISKKFEVIAIHFDNQPFSSKKIIKQVKKLCKKLKIKKLFIINHGKNQIELMKNCNNRYRCILCRRLMFKISEKLAKKYNYKYIVTGENLAQVCSQTLENLTTADKAIKITILRPLLCYDKQDIINMAKKIGTYDISIETGGCCNVVPKNPATISNLKVIENEEKKINTNQLINNVIKTVKIIDIK